MIKLLINQESFLFERYFKRLLVLFADLPNHEFNYDRVSAARTSAAQVVDLCDTVPVMSDFRAVVIEDIELFKKNDLELLAAHFKNPNPKCHIIMTGQKIDKRTSFYKNLLAVGEVTEFEALYANQVLPFLHTECKNLGLVAEPGSLELLFDRVGNSLMSLVNELEKLKLYVQPQNKITVDHVGQLIGSGPVLNLFVLSELVAKKKLGPLSDLLTRLFDQGESPIMLMAIVVGHFRKLILAKSFLADAGARENGTALAAVLKVSPYFAKDYAAQCRGFSLAELKALYRRLMDVSLGMRNSGAAAETWFFSFVQAVSLGR